MEATEGLPTDLEVLKKMEDEHLRLQRQVRHIQADRKAGTVGMHPQFRRQDLLLRVLKKEYINLVKDLKIAQSGAHKKKDKRMKSELKKALLARKGFEMDCDEGVTLMDQLEELFQRQKKEMLQLKKAVSDKSGQINQRRFQSENRLISTENRLEKAMKRFNVVQQENKNIRDEIEHMLKHRATFNQEWERMLKVLKKGKTFLHDLFESSTLAYDQRDEWCAKLHSVQEKAKIDQMVQLQEMRDLQKAFDHEMKLFYFLAKKGVIRVNKKQEEREESQRKIEDEKTRVELMKHCCLVENITDYTQEDEFRTMESFKRREVEVFTIYRLLTETCSENVVLSKDVKKLTQMIEDRIDWNDMKEEKRNSTIIRLKCELQAKQDSNAVLQQKVDEKDTLLHNTMDKINDIFQMLQCSLEPYQNLLGDKKGTLNHLNLTYSIINAKVQELLEVIYYCERHLQKKMVAATGGRLKKFTVYAETPRFFTPLPMNLLVPADPCPACVEARWFSRLIDKPETPFTKKDCLEALAELNADPAFVRSDRVHPITECRVPASRVILANRYMQ